MSCMYTSFQIIGFNVDDVVQIIFSVASVLSVECDCVVVVALVRVATRVVDVG